MTTATNNKSRADSAKSQPASATNGSKHTTATARPATRFGHNVGVAILFALAIGAAQEARAGA